MVKVGITGGIGSGKTAVCDIWQSLGAYVLNADDLAKKIMAEDEGVRRQITHIFGEQSYRSDGSLNRAYLAEQAFGKSRVEELNAIVHPKIPAKSMEIIDQAGREGYNVFVYEAALLFGNLTPGFLDYVVLVLAGKQERLERVAARDGVEEGQVLERMSKQQDFEKLTHLADFVIENNGTRNMLKQKATQLFHKFLANEG